MLYKVDITKHALKELIALPIKVSTQITKAIDSLEKNPRPIGSKKLKGETDYLWRIRVGNYRVIYTIEDAVKIIEVRKIGHRKDIYD